MLALHVRRAVGAARDEKMLPEEGMQGLEQMQLVLTRSRDADASDWPPDDPDLLPFPAGTFSFRPHCPLTLRAIEPVIGLNLSGLFSGRDPGMASFAASRSRRKDVDTPLLVSGHLLRGGSARLSGSGATPPHRDTFFKGSVYRRAAALQLDGEGNTSPTLLACGSDDPSGGLVLLGEWLRGQTTGGFAATLSQVAAASSPPDARACAASVARRLRCGLLDFRVAGTAAPGLDPSLGHGSSGAVAPPLVPVSAVAFPLAALQPCARSCSAGVCAHLTVPAVPDLLAVDTACTIIAAVFLPQGATGWPSAVVASPRWGLGVDAEGHLVGWVRPSDITPPTTTALLTPLLAWWGASASASTTPLRGCPLSLRSPFPLSVGRWIEVALSVDPLRREAVLVLDGERVASASTGGAGPHPNASSAAPFPVVIGTDLQYAFTLPAAVVGGAADATLRGLRGPPAALAKALGDLEAGAAAAEDAPGGMHDAHAEMGAFAAVPSRSFPGLIRDVVLAAGSLLPPPPAPWDDSEESAPRSASAPDPAGDPQLVVLGHWPCRGAESVAADVSGCGRNAILRTRNSGAPRSLPGRREVVPGCAPFLGHAIERVGDVGAHDVSCSDAPPEGASARPLLLPRCAALSPDRLVLPVVRGAAPLAAEGGGSSMPPALFLAGSVLCAGPHGGDAAAAGGTATCSTSSALPHRLGAAVDSTPRPIGTDFNALVSVQLASSHASSPSSVRVGFHGTSEVSRLSGADLYCTPGPLQGRGGGGAAGSSDWVDAAIGDAEWAASLRRPDAEESVVDDSAFDRSRRELEAWLSQLHSGSPAGPPPVTHVSRAVHPPLLLPPLPIPEGSPLVAPAAPAIAGARALLPHEDAARRCARVVAVDVTEVIRAPTASASGHISRRREFVVTVVRLSPQTAQRAVERSAKRSGVDSKETGVGAAIPIPASDSAPVLGKRERARGADPSAGPGSSSESGADSRNAAPSLPASSAGSAGAVLGQGTVWLDADMRDDASSSEGTMLQVGSPVRLRECRINPLYPVPPRSCRSKSSTRKPSTCSPLYSMGPSHCGSA